MRYLLDTHVLLWYLFDEDKLSEEVKNILRDSNTEIYLSAVNFWEISVKYSIGKLDLKMLTPAVLTEKCLSYGFKLLPISSSEAASYFQLKSLHHKDPFDRMLIWQAIYNNFTLISNDGNIPPYVSDGLKLMW